MSCEHPIEKWVINDAKALECDSFRGASAMTMKCARCDRQLNAVEVGDQLMAFIRQKEGAFKRAAEAHEELSKRERDARERLRVARIVSLAATYAAVPAELGVESFRLALAIAEGGTGDSK